MSKQAYLIPLGLRCNSAMVTQKIVNQPRFTFDWIQMHIDSMINVLQLESSQLKSFWQSYFSQLDETNHNTITGSWFPHDKFATPEEYNSSVEKYIRRTERLLATFETSTPVIYLIFLGFPETDSMEKVNKLLKAISLRHKGELSFIICNALFHEGEIGNMYFLYEPLSAGKGDEDWDYLTDRVTLRVNQILKEKQLQIIPFQVKDSI